MNFRIVLLSHMKEKKIMTFGSFADDYSFAIPIFTFTKFGSCCEAEEKKKTR